jgi:hypothetical protein
MYLVSPDYLNKKERPLKLSTKPARKTKTKAKTKKKIHPYDKWIATRAKIEEAAIGRKALMKAIADFVKAILPETTKIPLPKVESSVQTSFSSSSIARRHLPMLSGEEEEVFETGPTTTTTSDDDDDDDEIEVRKSDVQAYARKSYGDVASPYMEPFIHETGTLVVGYGLRKVGDKFYIGNSVVTVDKDINFHIQNKRFKGTRGLWELLTRKIVEKKLVTNKDLAQYKDILDLTSAHLVGYDPSGAIRTSRAHKFRNFIAKLYPHWEKILGMASKLYYDPTRPSSFGTLKKLQQATKRPPRLAWLEEQDTYTMHRRVRKHFPRNPYTVNNINGLVDVQNLSITAVLNIY